MVHKHFEEHKNQLFAGKKLKKHDRLLKGQKKNRTKVLLRGIRHDCSICRKILFSVSLRTPLLQNVANRSHQLYVINNKPFSTTSTCTFIKLVKAVQTSHQLLFYKDIKYKQYLDKINKEIRIVHFPKNFFESVWYYWVRQKPEIQSG